MKHLPKHLQPRWRYLAVGIETLPEATIARGPFQRELWYAAQNLVGDVGSVRRGSGEFEAHCRIPRVRA